MRQHGEYEGTIDGRCVEEEEEERPEGSNPAAYFSLNAHPSASLQYTTGANKLSRKTVVEAKAESFHLTHPGSSLSCGYAIS